MSTAPEADWSTGRTNCQSHWVEIWPSWKQKREANKIMTILHQRHYPAHVLQSIILRAHEIPREKLFENLTQKEDKKIKYIITSNPRNPPVNLIMEQNAQYLLTKKGYSNIIQMSKQLEKLTSVWEYFQFQNINLANGENASPVNHLSPNPGVN